LRKGRGARDEGLGDEESDSYCALWQATREAASALRRLFADSAFVPWPLAPDTWHLTPSYDLHLP
jgi:hypothetical protein